MSQPIKFLFVFGTRPEAIKLAPLIAELKSDPGFQVLVCSTGQHREMLRSVLPLFEVVPDFDLDMMQPGQTLADVTTRAMQGIADILRRERVDAIIVQGDTTSSFAAGLVGFYAKIPVVHVEAGLRTGDKMSPFPEEFNRRALALVADLHFAPTETARRNLLKEGVSASCVFVTGNTGIDALMQIRSKLTSESDLRNHCERRFDFLNSAKKLLLVTCHRRESFGATMEEIMQGLVLLGDREDIEIVMPLHLNPNVRACAARAFAGNARWAGAYEEDGVLGSGGRPSNIWLCEPQEYVPFIYLMERAHLIITDSGGVQEEGPSFAKPVLVAREKTERNEAIAAGAARLIPLEARGFADAVCEFLDCDETYAKMARAQNPYGDGTAARQIHGVLKVLMTR